MSAPIGFYSEFMRGGKFFSPVHHFSVEKIWLYEGERWLK